MLFFTAVKCFKHFILTNHSGQFSVKLDGTDVALGTEGSQGTIFQFVKSGEHSKIEALELSKFLEKKNTNLAVAMPANSNQNQLFFIEKPTQNTIKIKTFDKKICLTFRGIGLHLYFHKCSDNDKNQIFELNEVVHSDIVLKDPNSESYFYFSHRDRKMVPYNEAMEFDIIKFPSNFYGLRFYNSELFLGNTKNKLNTEPSWVRQKEIQVTITEADRHLKIFNISGKCLARDLKTKKVTLADCKKGENMKWEIVYKEKVKKKEEKEKMEKIVEEKVESKLKKSKELDLEKTKKLNLEKEKNDNLKGDLDAEKERVLVLEKELDIERKRSSELEHHKNLNIKNEGSNKILKGELDAEKERVLVLEKELDIERKRSSELEHHKNLNIENEGSNKKLKGELDAEKKKNFDLEKELELERKRSGELEHHKNLNIENEGSNKKLKEDLNLERKKNFELEKDLNLEKNKNFELEMKNKEINEKKVNNKVNDINKNNLNINKTRKVLYNKEFIKKHNKSFNTIQSKNRNVFKKYKSKKIVSKYEKW